jgi:putative membrane protein
VTAAARPFDWHLHLLWLLGFVALAGTYLRVTSLGRWRATTRQRLLFLGGLMIMVFAVTWPLGDLAAHWLLLALVLQRLLLTLAVPPLLVLGTPRPLISWLTRPAPVDAVLRVVVRPLPAVAIVTVVAVGTLTTGAVGLAARSDLARVLIELVVLTSGFVLWAPVLTELPGEARLSPLGRGAYLMVQSIVPSFLSIVWIFARHPLYPPFSHQGKVVAMTPLLDQQLAGFLAKLSTIAVLWTVAFLIMMRANAAEERHEEPDPLLWSDVQRELERADRRERRQRWPGPPVG